MINSQKEYLVAKEKINNLKQLIVTENEKNIPDILKIAIIGQIKELISEIENEINEYKSTKTD